MSNLMSMLYTGASGIFANQVKIDVTGHNIANIDNPNYSKQRVNTVSAAVSKDRNGAFGRGVKVEEVIRIYDDLLARSVRNESSSLSYWKGSQEVMSDLKLYFNELEEGAGLGESLKSYFESWQGLANTAPDNTDDAYIRRTDLAEKASGLALKIRETREMFDGIKDKINTHMQDYVRDINSMAKNIADLNGQILRVEATDEHANDLRDHRDTLMDQMAQIVGINVVHRPTGSVAVYIGGQPIVDDGDAYVLEAKSNPDKEGMLDIYWSTGEWYDKGMNITPRINGGTMQGEIRMRDEVIKGYVDELDNLSRMLINETNKLHVSGQGLERVNQLTSSNNVLNPEWKLSTAAGDLPYPIEDGSFQIHIYDKEGKIADTYTIHVDAEGDTLNGVAEKIRAADGNLSNGLMDATVLGDGSLRLRVDPAYTFAFGPDTSNFLTAAGFNNFFSGTDSATIDVDKFIRENPKYIACADHTGGVGNNRVALNIIDLKSKKLPSGISIDEFYGYITGKIAIDRQQIDVLVTTKNLSYNEILLKHQNMKGVSLEEEEINMVIFQRALEANSRYVNTVDEMLNLVVNNLGLVGR